MKKVSKSPVVTIDGGNVSFSDIVAVARDGVVVEISKNKNFVKRMERTQKILMESMRKGIPVYGVTTGYGKSCGQRMSMNDALKNGDNIFRFHGCGTGEPISTACWAVMPATATVVCSPSSLASNSGFSSTAN